MVSRLEPVQTVDPGLEHQQADRAPPFFWDEELTAPLPRLRIEYRRVGGAIRFRVISKDKTVLIFSAQFKTRRLLSALVASGVQLVHRPWVSKR
jgi:hypothetical protein